jgi:lambda family phage minor tail protein L
VFNGQESSFGVIATLYEIDTTIYGGPVIRLCPSTLENGGPVVFNGSTYTPFPIEASGFEVNNSQPPRPQLLVSGLQPLLMGGINQYRGLQNCKVTRIRVRRSELDDENPAITTDFINVDVFHINKIKTQTATAIDFELITKMELSSNQKFPRRTMSPYCNYTYRRFVDGAFVYSDINPCPYVGSACFTKGNQVGTQATDQCSKTIDGCGLRFESNLPFQGFPSFTGD